jgi:hypothetical protein
MDIIHQCLSLAPVPYLVPAFSLLRNIWSSVEQAQASKRQLGALAQSIAQLLQTLDGQYRAWQLLQVQTLEPLTDLCGFVIFTLPCQDLDTEMTLSCRLLEEILVFIEKEGSCVFLKLLFTKDQRIAKIDEYHKRIASSVTSFQVSSPLQLLHILT